MPNVMAALPNIGGALCSFNPLSCRLSNPFDNRFDNRLYRVYKHSTGCQNVFVKLVVQPGLSTRFGDEQLFVQHGCQTGCQTGCTTGLTTGCIV